MNNFGKTSTIFLIVISVLLLSLTAISLFFYKNESDLRKSLEVKLQQSDAMRVKLDAELKDAKKEVYLLEEKNKEYDDKINNLMDEIELQNSVKEQMKSENTTLKEALTKESRDKEALKSELTAAQEKMLAIEEKLKEAEKIKSELESKLNQMVPAVPATTAETPVPTPSESPQSVDPAAADKPKTEGAQVDLDKIVVKPDDLLEGKVISINSENNFLIFNLGQEQGIKTEMVLSVYRNNKLLGDIKVARVEDGMSVADFVAPLTPRQVKKDDRVVIKK